MIKHERRFYFLACEPLDLAQDIEQFEATYTIPELLDAVSAYAFRAGMLARAPVGTRYFRSITRVDGQPLDGVLYSSTRHPGGEAVVLFADTFAVEDVAYDDCWGGPQPWLRMVSYEQVEFDPEAA